MAAFRRRLTYANVMSTLALFVALGGSSYAALTITGDNVRDGSLTGRDIKNGSLSGRHVRSGSLQGSDIGTQTVTRSNLRTRSIVLYAPEKLLEGPGCVDLGEVHVPWLTEKDFLISRDPVDVIRIGGGRVRFEYCTEYDISIKKAAGYYRADTIIE